MSRWNTRAAPRESRRRRGRDFPHHPGTEVTCFAPCALGAADQPKEDGDARLESSPRRRLPLPAGADQGQRAAAGHNGLSLHRLPEDEFLRAFSLSAAIASEGFAVTKGEPRDRRAAWSDAALFLPALHELDVHAAGRLELVRQHPLHHAGRHERVCALCRNLDQREADVAETGAVRSYETLPPNEAWEGLTKEYQEWVS